MAGLLITQQVTRAADIHVVAGELEARAEAIERFKNFETFLCLLIKTDCRIVRDIGIGANFRAPDATADLIELRQTE